MGVIKRENIGKISMFALLIIYAISMAVATFVENSHGTPVARKWFYYSSWFISLEFLLVVNFLYLIIQEKMIPLKKWGGFIFHMAFVIIFLGAGITHFFSYEGVMHIREGEKVNYILVGENRDKKEIPFEVYLNDFKLKRYPGSHSPSSFESHITLTVDGKSEEKVISMNNVVDVKGYRLFQASYDHDEQGTVLSVNYDKAGMVISYIGYILLIGGMLVTLFQRNSRFRQLIKNIKEEQGKTAITLLLLLSATLPLHANKSTDNIPSVTKEQASQFGELIIQNPKGRLEPVNSWALKITQKLCQSETFNGFTSEQILLNLLTYPLEWAQVKLVKVKNKEVVKRMGLSGNYISFNDTFDSNGQYIFQKDIDHAYHLQPSERTKLDNDILKLDEAVNIIYQIQQGQLIALFPDENDPSGKWYSPGDDLSSFHGKDSLFVTKIMLWYTSELQDNNTEKAKEVLGMIDTYQHAKNKAVSVDKKKIEMEIWYNKMQIFSSIFKYYLITGALLLLCICVGFFSQAKYLKTGAIILTIIVGGIFLYHTLGLALRWYISGYAPWSNSYESIVFLSWTTALGGLLFAFRFRIIAALASILSGVLLFVASLNQMNPEITPLVPVLQSFWLMLHVAVIMAGYGFFFISAMIGLFNLTLMAFANNEKTAKSIRELTMLNEVAMILGLVLMTAGTFLGAVWANESWGRYWGWDPKETWALISIIVYTLVSHLRLIPQFKSAYLFNLLSVLAISSVLMTYFGVNYYLSGMHSYGKTDGQVLPLPLIIGTVIIVLIAILARRKTRDKQQIEQM
ncbi:MAG: cytochrome c biogenesis protein CcsA [Dysgonomonas sp.]